MVGCGEGEGGGVWGHVQYSEGAVGTGKGRQRRLQPMERTLLVLLLSFVFLPFFSPFPLRRLYCFGQRGPTWSRDKDVAWCGLGYMV